MAETWDERALRLLSIFDGNPKAVGAENGGCLRIPLAGDMWGNKVVEHFEGGEMIGVYPVWAGKVKWGCVDWDNGPGDITHAFNVKNVIDKVTDTRHATWVEASRTKGFHLWWFIESWVPMRTMREALLAACELVDAPTREVNPKQFELTEGQLGNYVRLPLPGFQMGADRGDGYLSRTFYERIFDGVDAMSPSEWLFRCVPGTHTDVEKMAAYYTPPVVVEAKYKPIEGNPVEKLGGLARKMFLEGPLENEDRSSQIYRFGRLLVEGQRHTPDEAESLIVAFDLMYNDPPKYAERADGEKRVKELVQRVFEEGVDNGY